MKETLPVILGQSVPEELHLLDKQIEPDRLALIGLAKQVEARVTDDVRILIDRPPVFTPDGFWIPEDPDTLLRPEPTDIYIRPQKLDELLITAVISETLRTHRLFGRDYRRYNDYQRRLKAIGFAGGLSLGTSIGSIASGHPNTIVGLLSAFTLIGSLLASGANYIHYGIVDASTTSPPTHASPESTPPIRLIDIQP